MAKPFRVPVAGEQVGALHYPPTQPQGRALVLAHGAGADQRSPFMVECATGLAARGLEVVTFNFLYRERGRRVPDPTATLEACWRAVIAAAVERLGAARLFIGGKSLGGRIASHVAAADPRPIAGMVFLGFPLHPPGRPGTERARYLVRIGRPMLFVQGSRDALGAPDELGPVVAALAPPGTLYVVEDGDHSFAVRKKSGRSSAVVREAILDEIARWMALAAPPPAG
jgi:predicted alpha/beta-hydrolase family hydrolase